MSVTSNLSYIAAHSATLRERLSPRVWGRGVSRADNRSIDSPLIGKWREVLDVVLPGAFDRRLVWDNLGAGTLAALRDTQLRDEPLPRWTRTLASIMRQARISCERWCSDRRSSLAIHNTRRIPFAELLWPALVVAQRKLTRRLKRPLSELLAASAVQALELSLLRHLSALSQEPMYELFSTTRTAGCELADLLSPRQHYGRKRYYEPFIDDQLSSGLVSLFRAYPVLARLTALTVEKWVSSNVSFIKHLSADYKRLHDAFEVAPRPDSGQVIVEALTPDLSDLHNGGRSVIRVRFTSGLQAIYKPRDVATEDCWAKLVVWLNSNGLEPRLAAARVVACSDHGWVEAIEQRPCESEAAARRYYARMGMLICIAYALGSADLHYDNIIASGECPVIVDCEMVVYPRLEPFPEVQWDDQSEASKAGVHTTLASSLLPRWEVWGDSQYAFDLSGMCGDGGQRVPYRRRLWRHVNKDGMRRDSRAARLPQRHNRAYLERRRLEPYEYRECIQAGFDTMYENLSRSRNTLLTPASPLARLADTATRVLLRPTAAYLSLQRAALTTECLRLGAVRSLCFERLALSYLGCEEKPPQWPLLAAEVGALEELDVPRTTVCGEGCGVMVDDRTKVENLCISSGLQRSAAIIGLLCDADRHRQWKVVEDALAVYEAGRRSPRGKKTSVCRIRLDERTGIGVAPSVLRAAAAEIGRTLEERAFETESGGVTWVGNVYDTAAGRFQTRELAWSVYDGVSGIALFLAALHRSTGSERWRSLALRAIWAVQRGLRESSAKGSKAPFGWRSGIGAAGFGGVLASLARIGMYFEDRELLGEALDFVEKFDRRGVEGESTLDFMGGSAGLLLGCLELALATGDGRPLLLAERCGERLVAAQRKGGPQAGGWITVAPWPLAGFAHGAAGIAYAIARLHAVSPSEELRRAVSAALTFEDGLFTRRRGNWADVRGGLSRRRYMVGWCHGAAGIGAARASMADTGATVVDQAMLRIAASTVRTSMQGELDQLCCGVMGRVDSLLELGRVLDEESSIRIAQSWACGLAHRVLNGQGLRLFSPAPGAVDLLGLFQGLAGVGYECLRVADANSHLSVLLWGRPRDERPICSSGAWN